MHYSERTRASLSRALGGAAFGRPAADRPRRLQAGQRHLWPSPWRPVAGRLADRLTGRRPRGRPRRPDRRGRVRHRPRRRRREAASSDAADRFRRRVRTARDHRGRDDPRERIARPRHLPRPLRQCRRPPALRRSRAVPEQERRQGRGRPVRTADCLHAYEYRQRMEAEFRVALAGGQHRPRLSADRRSGDGRDRSGRGAGALDRQQRRPTSARPISSRWPSSAGSSAGSAATLLEKALLETAAWIDAGQIERVSFNVSPLEFLDEDFSRSGPGDARPRPASAPRHLLLEITEGAVLENLRAGRAVMVRLRSRGVQFALDDFGCGYSDLSTLRKLPIWVLKIDRSLLVDAEHDQPARIILRNVVALVPRASHPVDLRRRRNRRANRPASPTELRFGPGIHLRPADAGSRFAASAGCLGRRLQREGSPSASATTGPRRWAITSTPRALGCSPSSSSSAGWPITPSRKNG